MKIFKSIIFLFTIILLITSCNQSGQQIGELVSNAKELQNAIANAKPGNSITMANGIWADIEIKFYGEGTEDKPITLRAETSGSVIIQGNSNLKLGGEHLKVDGLYFTNGASPDRAVIQYFINNDTLANHSQITNCVIKDFNKPQKNQQDLWVVFKGRHNQLDHCYLAGKSNRGPTIRINLAGNESIKNHHKIIHNHFGPRPPKGGPSAETIQIGNSGTSMAPSHTLVANNLFDRCNGEVEVISSKTNFNEFRNNIFYKSEGSLVTRHGNYCIIDGNYFIGDESSNNIGGVRLIGTGHWVTNNYFYKLKGEVFRAPLAVMNGIRRSAINRYIQVTDVVVAHNTYIDCKSPWQFGVGSNVDQRDVLPASEIRSETPIRTTIANNVIYNSKGDPMPIFRHDSIDGIDFISNVINNQGVRFTGVKGLEEMDFSTTEVEDNVLLPSKFFDEVELYEGFDFDQIKKDLFGNSREKNNPIGAAIGASGNKPAIMEQSKYGTDWYNPTPPSANSKTLNASTAKELREQLSLSKEGDIIVLTSDQYKIDAPLQINKPITIQSADTLEKAIILYTGPPESPAFEMNPKGQLTLKSISLKGTPDNFAFATLKENMSSLYNLKVMNTEISNFDRVLMAYKHSFSEHIQFINSKIYNCDSGLLLASEDDAKGEYNVENLSILDCQFKDVHKNLIDYYRGGYDESTVGGNLVIKGSTFSKCGAEEKSGVLIKTHGIINVDISSNQFLNNPVTLVARLWGAKNNTATQNTFKNSGKIETVQNLPQKLMY